MALEGFTQNFNLHFRVNSLSHHLYSQCYAAQHSIVWVSFCFCQATEIPNLGSTSNSLPAENPSSAESAINVLELEENQFSAVKKVDEKPNDNNESLLERTYQNIKHGAQVEPTDEEPRSAGMTAGEGPNSKVYDIKV